MQQIRRTKIIATMGPATDSVEIIESLIRAGMSIARLNFSHGDHSTHDAKIAMVREASARTGIPVAIMLDTKGPEIRTGVVPGGGTIELVRGSEVRVTFGGEECGPSLVSLSYPELLDDASVGTRILIADGLIELETLGREGAALRTVVRSGGTIGSRKNVNVPGVRTKLPAITEKDEADIRFGMERCIDFIAASFIRKPQDVTAIYSILESGGSRIKVIAKIEDEEGLENIDDILRVSNGIMIARGDLGVQIKGELIPLVQKRIIAKCNKAGKPVITATQMLDSMITNPRPTRAELTDVANAVMDGTDAIMLSGETASGKHPLLAVETMHNIALAIEQSEEYWKKMAEVESAAVSGDIAHAVAKAGFVVAREINAQAILAPTLSGNTPRLLSGFRPAQPIIAATTTERVQRQLLLDWGVIPIIVERVDDSEEMIQNAIMAATDKGLLDLFDKVVAVAGVPINSPIMTNTVRVFFLGSILNRGSRGFGASKRGRIVKAADLAEAALVLKKQGGEILLTKTLDDSFIPIIRCVDGIILEGVSELNRDMILMVNPDITFIGEVPNAMAQFENGSMVTLDGEEKIIYEGFVRN